MKLILNEKDVERLFDKKLVQLYKDTEKSIGKIVGIEIFATSEDIKDAILLEIKE